MVGAALRCRHELQPALSLRLSVPPRLPRLVFPVAVVAREGVDHMPPFGRMKVAWRALPRSPHLHQSGNRIRRLWRPAPSALPGADTAPSGLPVVRSWVYGASPNQGAQRAPNRERAVHLFRLLLGASQVPCAASRRDCRRVISLRRNIAQRRASPEPWSCRDYFRTARSYNAKHLYNNNFMFSPFRSLARIAGRSMTFAWRRRRASARLYDRWPSVHMGEPTELQSALERFRIAPP